MDGDTQREILLMRAEVASWQADQMAVQEKMLARTQHSWLVRTLAKMIKGVEEDPQVQYRVHLTAMWFWFAMTIIVVFVFIFAQGLWLDISILYIVLISHYANWATDFDGASSSLAALHAREARKKAEAAEQAARRAAGEVPGA